MNESEVLKWTKKNEKERKKRGRPMWRLNM